MLYLIKFKDEYTDEVFALSTSIEEANILAKQEEEEALSNRGKKDFEITVLKCDSTTLYIKLYQKI
jgi:hypothetical protein